MSPLCRLYLLSTPFSHVTMALHHLQEPPLMLCLHPRCIPMLTYLILQSLPTLLPLLPQTHLGGTAHSTHTHPSHVYYTTSTYSLIIISCTYHTHTSIHLTYFLLHRHLFNHPHATTHGCLLECMEVRCILHAFHILTLLPLDPTHLHLECTVHITHPPMCILVQ